MTRKRLLLAGFGVLAAALVFLAIPLARTEAVEPPAPVPEVQSAAPKIPAELLELGIDREVTIVEDPSFLLELGAEAQPAAKGKKPPQCTDCASTLGFCSRVSCAPCCYECPDLPYLVCTS